MWCLRIKYRRSFGYLILLILLLVNNLLYPQERIINDSVVFNFPDRIVHLPGCPSFSFYSTFMGKPGNLVPTRNALNNSSVFLDYLEAKALRYLVTRELYNFLIVSREPSIEKQITKSSENIFLPYSGRKIRKIEINRLDVFGSDINNPLASHPNKIESLVNKTHINTTELIIRKNLLFSEGDTVSPLIISDNERIIRQLPFINDSRIIVVPVSDADVDIVVITKDVYSLGASFDYSSIKKGSISVFEENVLGLGHEFRLEVPYDSKLPHSPGIGIKYKIDNIARLFINLNLYYFNGLGEKTYGFSIDRKLISSATKYAGGISVREMFTTEDLDTLPKPEPLKYNLQDYWFSRSFLLKKESAARLIISARYTNNNVFDHPLILPDSYHYLQKYKMFLASAAFSIQRYYKTNLIYGYGRTEDIPYGGLLNITAGKEINEFKKRVYTGINFSVGNSVKYLGYFYTSAGFSTFFKGDQTEQGMLLLRTSFFSNLLYLGSYRIRNFVKIDYTRGFDRYSDEYLFIYKENGFSGFRNDSLRGTQRLTVSLESVVFSPKQIFGFRFAYFIYADLGVLFGTNQYISEGEVISSIGAGVRFRNDNLVFNTFQIRFGFFPNLPLNSKINYFSVYGEQLLRPESFDPGPPSIILYK